MPFLDEIAARLVAQGVGTIGASIFLGSKAVIPAGDGPYLSLTETGGTGSERTHNGVAVAKPGAQILSRAKSYVVARARLKLAWDALGGDKGLHNVTLSGTFYQSITPRQQPTDVGLDAESRPMLSFNILAEKQPS
jgi:hypothetical protein